MPPKHSLSLNLLVTSMESVLPTPEPLRTIISTELKTGLYSVRANMALKVVPGKYLACNPVLLIEIE